MKKNKNKNKINAKIGGQALIEGIMMRGGENASMAVRKKDGNIAIEEWKIKTGAWYQKMFLIRGVTNFILQMSDGYKYISKSAEISGMLESEDEQSGSGSDFIMIIAMIFGFAVAIVLFMFVPTWLFSGLKIFLGNNNINYITRFRSLFEGIIKIIIFIGYLWATSLMKDIRRTYEYHGAEHKTIAAYEAGAELTPENVKKHIRFHPRCGTSFIFLSLAVSILFYSVLPINSEVFVDMFDVSQFTGDLIRVLLKLILLPVVVGISYELIRLSGSYDNFFTRIISAPGLWLQRLTTKEPDESQIEVAIAAVNVIIDKLKN